MTSSHIVLDLLLDTVPKIVPNIVRNIMPTIMNDQPTLPAALTHAGGIVARAMPEGVRYLLVRSRKNAMHWVLPKGHIDPGESAEEAAVREVREEAGVEAALKTYVGLSEFEFASERCRVGFYLMKFVREVPADEDREIAWQSFESAMSSLAFDDMRDLLRLARAMRVE